jgi:ATP-dependent exoDNAse (exonuclease V) beta subunit
VEFSRTFILGMAQFQPSKYATQDWMKVQEDNLAYVAITRAKDALVHITDVPTKRANTVEE